MMMMMMVMMMNSAHWPLWGVYLRLDVTLRTHTQRPQHTSPPLAVSILGNWLEFAGVRCGLGHTHTLGRSPALQFLLVGGDSQHPGSWIHMHKLDPGSTLYTGSWIHHAHTGCIHGCWMCMSRVIVYKFKINETRARRFVSSPAPEPGMQGGC